MSEPWNVLSLFDGISGGMMAMERAGYIVGNYFASEIDQYSIQASQDNYPEIVQLGSVLDWKSWNLPRIDILFAGFPCQSYSNAGKGLGINDLRGQLVYPMLKIIEKYRPRFLLLENVKGLLSKKNLPVVELILSELKKYGYGDIVVKVMDSALVSAQSRERVYFTNWDYPEPEDRGILLQDIIENGYVNRDKAYCIDANYWKGGNIKSYFEKGRRQLVFDTPVISGDEKFSERFSISDDFYEDKISSIINWRMLTSEECEKLQTVPVGFTSCLSNSRRKQVLGNGWTINIIAHMLDYLPL